jgi:hypothetical protein
MLQKLMLKYIFSWNKELKKTLKRAMEVRWNSLLTMLKSISDQFDDIKRVLALHGNTNLLTNIEVLLLQALVEVLQPFEDVTKILEKFKKPTIHEVIYCRVELIASLESNEEDRIEIRELKSVLLADLIENWKIEPIYIAAAILDPLQKDLLQDILGLDRHDIAKGLGFITNICYRMPIPTVSNVPSPISSSSSSSTSSKRIKISNIVQKYRQVQENSTLSQKVNQEFSSYIDSKLEIEDEEPDILKIWNSLKNQYKYLSYAARVILAVPASSSKSESDFSLAGRTKTKARASLKASNLDALVTLRANMDLYERSN